MEHPCGTISPKDRRDVSLRDLGRDDADQPQLVARARSASPCPVAAVSAQQPTAARSRTHKIETNHLVEPPPASLISSPPNRWRGNLESAVKAADEEFARLLQALSASRETDLRRLQERADDRTHELERQNHQLRSTLAETLKQLGVDETEIVRAVNSRASFARTPTTRAKQSLKAAAGQVQIAQAFQEAMLPAGEPPEMHEAEALPGSVPEKVISVETIKVSSPQNLQDAPALLPLTIDNDAKASTMASSVAVPDGNGQTAEDDDYDDFDSDLAGERFNMLSVYESMDEQAARMSIENMSVTGPMFGTGTETANGLYGRMMREPSRQSTMVTQENYNGIMRRFVALPRSPIRVAWEFLGCLLIIYDLFIVPLSAFCFPETSFTIGMDWLTVAYWLLNMANTCTLAFEDFDMRLVVDPTEILTNYLKCWFWIDAVVIFPDLIFHIITFGQRTPGMTTCQNGAAGGGSSIKLLRSLRLVRLVRLTRISRLRRLWMRVQQMIYSVTVSIAANILVMVGLLLVISHFFSCAWFFISYHSEPYRDNGLPNRWLTEFNFDDEPWFYQYTTAMHWSITQFTPASMQITPQNVYERVFTICVVVFALVGFSYVVGSITGSLTQLRAIHEEQSKQFWDLRTYLRRNQVDSVLAHRIQTYLEHAWQREQENGSVKILGLLSEQLFSELQFHLSEQHLKVHPLFQELMHVSHVSAFRLASTAISRKMVARRDHLFLRGEKPTHMYIVIDGQLVYRRQDSLGRQVKEIVDKGEDWIAEPVLWTDSWYHLGNCEASLDTRLMLVEPLEFCHVAKRNPSSWLLVTNYCRKFLKWVNETEHDELSDISQGEEIGARLSGFMEIDMPSWATKSATFPAGKKQKGSQHAVAAVSERGQAALSEAPH